MIHHYEEHLNGPAALETRSWLLLVFDTIRIQLYAAYGYTWKRWLWLFSTKKRGQG